MDIIEALDTIRKVVPYQYNIPSKQIEAAKKTILEAVKKGDIDISLNKFTEVVHDNAVAHGWWNGTRSFAELIALCHCELSEALEEYRKGHLPEETYRSENGEIEGIPVELADVILRILDMCGHYGIDIAAILAEKHNYNKTRPYKHGGKVI